MTYQIQTRNKPCTLELKLQSNGEREIFAIGYDPSKRDTVFFKRIMHVDGIHTFYFGMPQSPKTLKFVIYDNRERRFTDPQTFKIISLKVLRLRKAPTEAGWLTRSYIKFIQQFSIDLPFLSPGSYTDDKERFIINLFPGRLEYATPARIEKRLNFIEVSKTDFERMTIPQRMIILLHEYSHNFLNKHQDSEIEADTNALRIYCGLGYPFIEGIYAFTHILKDSDFNMERLQSIEDFMIKHRLYIDKKG
ncbi:MAG: hypothetical protein ACTSXG_00580 [Alphaproteobacteria bacterium]